MKRQPNRSGSAFPLRFVASTARARSWLACLLIAFAVTAAGCESRDDGSSSTPTVEVTPARVALSLREWSIDPVPGTVDAGPVRFDAANDGAMFHAVSVVRTDLAPSELPVYAANDPIPNDHDVGDVNERDLVVVAEVGASDLPPGATKSVTVQLAAGHYVLVCNLPGHFRAGMYATFSVE